MKKSMINPVKGNHLENSDYFVKIMNGIGDALDSTPVDYYKVIELIYKISSPSFVYPEIKPCCSSCNVALKNEKYHKAFDILKTLDGKTELDDIREIYEIARLYFMGGK